MALSDNAAGGAAGDIFYDAPRVCERRSIVPGHPAIVHKPDRVKWGYDDVYEWHLCPDGVYGRLTLLYPPKIEPDVDPMIVTQTPLSELDLQEKR